MKNGDGRFCEGMILLYEFVVVSSFKHISSYEHNADTGSPSGRVGRGLSSIRELTVARVAGTQSSSFVPAGVRFPGFSAFIILYVASVIFVLFFPTAV